MSHNVGIIGASGYTGSELLRILASHSEIKVQIATGDSQAGNSVAELYPHLSSTYPQLKFRKIEEVASELKSLDLVFLALPHGEAMKVVKSIQTPQMIDLGSDFRLRQVESYSEWYGKEHFAPHELGEWQYGLTEFFRDKIKKANKIANPGCYPTAAALAIAPLLKEGLIEGPINIDALSGTSGAGRGVSPGLHFSHAFEDSRAYKVTKHQHTPEIEMAISDFSGKNVKVTFTPHLVPMVRGIHATCSAQVTKNVTQQTLFDALQSTFAKEKFVSVVNGSVGTKDVRGSNYVRIAPYLDTRTGRAVVISVIDNLVKGASGQAIQNANLLLGLDEMTALEASPLYP